MKNLIIVLAAIAACIILSGASKGKRVLYIGVYTKQKSPELFPEYLILKKGGTFDYNYAYLHKGYIGQYFISNDTLVTIPMYEYYEHTIVQLNPRDTSIFSIPRTYLIKQPLLIEITDFEPYPIINSFQDKEQSVFKKEK